MDISARFTSTQKEMVRGHRHAHRIVTLLSWGLAGLFVVSGVVWDDPVALVIGVCYLAYNALVIRQQVRRHHPGTASFTLTMTDSEYRIQGPSHGTTLSWSAFRKVVLVGDTWVLRAPKGGAMAFPASALDAAQTSVFKDFLRAKGLMPAEERPPR